MIFLLQLTEITQLYRLGGADNDTTDITQTQLNRLIVKTTNNEASKDDFAAIMHEVVSDFPKIFLNESNKAVITYPAKNAKIYYTTDGTEPVYGVSNIYTEPIDITGVACIKAIAGELAKFPSACASFKINWKEDLTIRYRGTVDMLLPPDSSIVSYELSNENVADIDLKNQTIHGNSVGKATVSVKLKTGQIYTYNVTVEYKDWQWIIIYFFFGWIWYVP